MNYIYYEQLEYIFRLIIFKHKKHGKILIYILYEDHIFKVYNGKKSYMAMIQFG